jgi:hypothetical protein
MLFVRHCEDLLAHVGDEAEQDALAWRQLGPSPASRKLAAAISANAGSSSTIVLWVGSVMATPIGEHL